MTKEKNYLSTDGTQAIELNRLAKNFIKLKSQYDELETELNTLKNEIKTLLDSENLTETTVFQTTQVEILFKYTPAKKVLDTDFLKQNYFEIYNNCLIKDKKKIIAMDKVKTR